MGLAEPARAAELAASAALTGLSTGLSTYESLSSLSSWLDRVIAAPLIASPRNSPETTRRAVAATGPERSMPQRRRGGTTGQGRHHAKATSRKSSGSPSRPARSGSTAPPDSGVLPQGMLADRTGPGECEAGRLADRLQSEACDVPLLLLVTAHDLCDLELGEPADCARPGDDDGSAWPAARGTGSPTRHAHADQC